MPKPEAAFQRCVVDLGLTALRELVPAGVEIASVWVKRVPGGVTTFNMKFGNNEAFEMAAGESFNLPCSVIRAGIFIETAPVLAGQTALIVFGVADPVEIG